MADAARDFRYTLGDVEIEAYQITPASRWRDEQWPDWIKKQRLTDDTNCVYTNADNPDVLWLALPGGDVELPYLAWIVKHANNNIGFIEALDMEKYTKVVPIPPPVVTPPADGIPDAATQLAAAPQRTTENLAGDTMEMRNEMLSAIKMLQDGNDSDDRTVEGMASAIEESHQEALDYLKKCLAARTLWCNCPPGQCASEAEDGADMDIASCRQKSPLVN